MRLLEHGGRCFGVALSSGAIALLALLASAQGARADAVPAVASVLSAAHPSMQEAEPSLAAAPNLPAWVAYDSSRPERTAVEAIDEASVPCGRLPRVTLNPGETGFSRCDFASASRGFNFSYKTDSASFGGFEAHAVAVRSTTGLLTPHRLLNRASMRLGEESLVRMVGASATFLQGGVKFSTELASSETWEAPSDDLPWLQLRRNERSGAARTSKLEVKLADSPALRWTVIANLDDVDEDYFLSQSLAQRGSIAMPGRRTAVSSTIKTHGYRILAATSHSTMSFGSFSGDRFGVDFDGVSLRLNLKNSTVTPPGGSGLLESRSESRGVNLDLDFNSLSPDLIAHLGELAPIMPQTLSLGLRSGRTQNALVSGKQAHRRMSWEADGTWDTPLGETTLSYLRDEKTAVTPGLTGTLDQMFMAAHTIRWNGWRFGVDAVLTRTASTGLRGYSDTTFTIGQTIAYSRPNGPEFRLQVGKDQARSRLNDDSYLSSESTFNVTASLDLTRHLRKRFERDDLHLTIDYRKRIDERQYKLTDSGELLDRWTEHYQPGGLLVSFGMKF